MTVIAIKKAGTTIRDTWQKNEHIFEVVKGHVLEFYNEKAFRICGPGDYFLVSDTKNYATRVMSITPDVEIGKLNGADTCIDLHAAILERQNEYLLKLLNMRSGNVDSRVAKALLWLETAGCYLSRKHLAEILDMATETCIRTIHSFRHEGVIETPSGRQAEICVILNREVLESIAENDDRRRQ